MGPNFHFLLHDFSAVWMFPHTVYARSPSPLRDLRSRWVFAPVLPHLARWKHTRGSRRNRGISDGPKILLFENARYLKMLIRSRFFLQFIFDRKDRLHYRANAFDAKVHRLSDG